MRRTLVALVFLLLATSATAHAAVPREFVGVISDGPMLTSDVNLEDELDKMQDAGVGSLRFSVYWNDLQPYETDGDVPEKELDRFVLANDVPTDWSGLDRFVGEASKRELDLLPVVLRTPLWARRHRKVGASTPTVAGRKAYANFMKSLVERYGPGGDFWTEHPYDTERPITRWQIWNEPNGPVFWAEQPGLKAYVKLLRLASNAIHDADPEAQVVLAGLFGKAWKPLRRLYLYGAADYFDVAAINPFSFKVNNVIKIIRRSRDIMHRQHADDTPLLVTELSWPSALGKVRNPYGFEVTEKGQAQRVRVSLRRIAKKSANLNLAGVFWSTWVSYDRDRNQAFDFAGLRTIKKGEVVNKPAFHAFKRIAKIITTR